MVWLGLVCGALFGWIAGDFGVTGLLVGALVGGPAGLGLRAAIQTEIRAILKEEKQAVLGRQGPDLAARRPPLLLRPPNRLHQSQPQDRSWRRSLRPS